MALARIGATAAPAAAAAFVRMLLFVAVHGTKGKGQQRRHGGDRRVFPGRGSQHAHPAASGRLADVAPYALFVVAVYPAQQRKVLRRLLQQFRQLPVLRRAVEPLPEDRQFLFGGGSLEAGFEYLSSTYKCNFLGADNKQ